jgi:hypothetical protein
LKQPLQPPPSLPSQPNLSRCSSGVEVARSNHLISRRHPLPTQDSPVGLVVVAITAPVHFCVVVRQCVCVLHHKTRRFWFLVWWSFFDRFVGSAIVARSRWRIFVPDLFQWVYEKSCFDLGHLSFDPGLVY